MIDGILCGWRQHDRRIPAVMLFRTPKGRYAIGTQRADGVWLPWVVSLASLRDNCDECRGSRGGMPGNETIVDGRTLCDSCLTPYQLEQERVRVKTLEAALRKYGQHRCLVGMERTIKGAENCVCQCGLSELLGESC